MSHDSGSTPQTPTPTRRLDARSLRGLAHPLRMSIFELLSLDGPATATGLARRIEPIRQGGRLSQTVPAV